MAFRDYDPFQDVSDDDILSELGRRQENVGHLELPGALNELKSVPDADIKAELETRLQDQAAAPIRAFQSMQSMGGPSSQELGLAALAEKPELQPLPAGVGAYEDAAGRFRMKQMADVMEQEALRPKKAFDLMMTAGLPDSREQMAKLIQEKAMEPQRALDLMTTAGLPSTMGGDHEKKAANKVKEDPWNVAIGKGIVNAPGEFIQGLGGVARAYQENLGTRTPFGRMMQEGDISGKMTRFGKRITDEVNAEPGTMKSYFSQAAGSIAQNMPWMLVGAITGNPAVPLLAIGVQEGGQKYEELRKAGKAPQTALGGSLISGGAEVVGEMAPLKILMQKGLPIMKRFVKSILPEITGEELTFAIKFMNDKGLIKPDMGWKEFGQGLVDTAIVTGIATPIQAGMMHPAVKIAERSSTQVKFTPEQEALWSEMARQQAVAATLPEKGVFPDPARTIPINRDVPFDQPAMPEIHRTGGPGEMGPTTFPVNQNIPYAPGPEIRGVGGPGTVETIPPPSRAIPMGQNIPYAPGPVITGTGGYGTVETEYPPAEVLAEQFKQHIATVGISDPGYQELKSLLLRHPDMTPDQVNSIMLEGLANRPLVTPDIPLGGMVPTEMGVPEVLSPPSSYTEEERPRELFDTSKTGMPFYDQVLSKPDYSLRKGENYWRDSKGYNWEIVEMSPDDYIDKAAEGLASTSKDRTKEQILDNIIRTRDTKGIADWVEKGNKLPLPVLEYGRDYFTQEGLHRAIYAKEKGLNNIPVLIFTQDKMPINDVLTKGVVAEGKPVPPEVLAEYPDLAPAKAKEPWEMSLKEWEVDNNGIFGLGRKISDRIMAKSEELKGGTSLKPTKAQIKDAAYFWDVTPADAAKALDFFNYSHMYDGVIKEAPIIDWGKYHKPIIKQALAEGKPVPPEVLAEYPELARSVPETTAQGTPEVQEEDASQVTEDPKWAVPGSGRMVDGEMVWENKFTKGKFGTFNGNFEDTPEKAVQNYRDLQTQAEQGKKTAVLRDEAIAKIKSGTYTDDDIKRATGYGLNASTGKIEGILRSMGLKSTQARKIIKSSPDVDTTAGGAILYNVRDVVERARKQGLLPELQEEQQPATPSEVIPEAVQAAQEEGIPLKKQKKYLLDNIEEALNKAPKAEDDVLLEKRNQLIQELEESKKAPGSSQGGGGIGMQVGGYSALATRLQKEISQAGGFVDIDIPGDGTFRIHNTKEAISDFMKRVKADFPTSEGKAPAPVTPASGPLASRLSGKDVSYYNPFRTRKQALIFEKPIKTKPGQKEIIPPNYYTTDGFYSNGNYALKIDKKELPKGIVLRSGELSVDAVIPKKVYYQPAEIAAEMHFGETDTSVPLAHFVGEDGRDVFTNASFVDAILSKYPDAKPFTVAGKEAESSPVLFKVGSEVGSEVVGVVMPMRIWGEFQGKELTTKQRIEDLKKDLGLMEEEPEKAKAEKSRESKTTAPVSEGEETASTEDAGVELTYNKRNRIRGGIKWEDIQGKNETLRVKETTKNNVYPKPDYQQMVADGMKPLVAHIVKQSYDGLANTPQVRGNPTDADLKLYIQAVNRYMEGVMKWATDTEKVAQWAQMLVGRAKVLDGMNSGVATNITDIYKTDNKKPLLESVYPGGWKEYREEIRIIGGNKPLKALQPFTEEAMKASKEIEKGWPGKTESWQRQGYEVVETSKAGKIKEGYRFEKDNKRVPVFWAELKGKTVSEGELNTREEAQAALDKMKPWALMHKGYRLIGQFDTREEAVEMAREKTKREAKEGQVSEKGTSVEMAKREGPARRQEGEDVSTEKLMSTFGFKGVNFGNWMKGKGNETERQLHVNHAYDAFLDLAEILGVPQKALSLNGLLGLAIGAQGSGKHAAHFVPGVNEINLTRTGGAGAVAHEWGHGIDHYFANLAGLSTSKDPWITEHIDSAKALGDVRPEIAEAFKTIVAYMRKRPMSEAETKSRMEVLKSKAKNSVEGWLKHIRRDFQGLEEEYDKLAEKVMSLELGEGWVSTGGRTHLSPTVYAIRELYKKNGKKAYPSDQLRGLQANVDHYRYINSDKAAVRDHTPQETNTAYLNESIGADKDKKGKKYWSTNLEMFARALDAYITDQLKERAQRNTYLSGIEAVPPRGEERTRLNEAFKTLFNAIQTKETDQGVAMFSITPTFYSQMERVLDKKLPGSGTVAISDKDLQTVIDRVTANWKNPPVIHVVNSLDELPDNIKEAAQKQRVSIDQIGGVHYNGHVYLPRPNIGSEARAEQVLLHEATGHFGLRGVLGKDADRKLTSLYGLINGSKGIITMSKKYNVDLSAYAKGIRDLPMDKKKQIMVEELLAHMAQDKELKASWRTRAKEIIGAIKDWLRKHGFENILKTYSDADLLHLLKQAREFVESGEGKADGGVRFTLTPQAMADKLGIKFDTEVDYPMIGKHYQFTDPQTGGTFLTKNVEDVPGLLEGKRETFKKAESPQFSKNPVEINVGDLNRATTGTEMPEEIESLLAEMDGGTPQPKKTRKFIKKAVKEGQILRKAGFDEKDIHPLQAVTDLPWWAAKQFPELRYFIYRQIQREGDRNAMVVRFMESPTKKRAGQFHEVLMLPEKQAEDLLQKAIIPSDRENRLMSKSELIDLGLTEEQMAAYYAYDRTMKKAWQEITDHAHAMLLRPYREQPWVDLLGDVIDGNITEAEAMATIDDDLQQTEFKYALHQTTDMRSALKRLRSEIAKVKFYFPRVREQGEYVVRARGPRGKVLHMERTQASVLGQWREKQEAEKIAERLHKQYPNAEIVMSHEQRTSEDVYQRLNDIAMERFIATAGQKLKKNEDVTDEARKATMSALLESVAEELKARGFAKHAIHRLKGSPVKGYKEENLKKVFHEYITGMAGILTKQDFAYDVYEKMSQIATGKNKVPERLFNMIQGYTEDMLRNTNQFDRASAKLRSLAFAYYLAANTKSAFVQLTQNYVTGIPLLAGELKDTKQNGLLKAERLYHKAMADVVVNHLNDEEKKLMQILHDRDVTAARFVQETLGKIGAKWKTGLNKVVYLASVPFSAMETFNRKSAGLARFRAARAAGVSFEEASQKASDFIFDTHYLMGKANMPSFASGKSVMNIAARTGLTFRMYNLNYFRSMINAVKKDAEGKRHLRTVARSLAYMAMAGGFLSWPFLDDLLDLLERATGYPARLKMRATLRKFGGEVLERFGMAGLPGLIGYDISGSLKMGLPWPLSGSGPNELYGVYGGLAQKIGKAGHSLLMGEYLRAAENALPVAGENVLKGLRMATKGATTAGEKTIYDVNDRPLKLTGAEAGGQMLGFRPARVAGESQTKRVSKNVEAYFKGKRDGIAERLRLAESKNDNRAWRQVDKDIDAYNRRVDIANRHDDFIPYIDEKWVEARLQERPGKRLIVK